MSASRRFRVRTEREGEHAVVKISGDLDIYSSSELRDALLDLVDAAAGTVVVDLSDVEFIDSTGLGVLVLAQKRLRQQGGEVILRSPSHKTRTILELTGLAKGAFTIEA